MSNFDAETLVQQAILLGLITREQGREAKLDAEDGSAEALIRSLLRKGLLTSWQVEHLQKGDPTGFFFGGCKVLFHLAEGSFARVYRGVNLMNQEPVAMKVLRQRFVADPDAVQRFQKEAEAGMKLKHENIVRILDFGEQDRRYYMIMEYVEGSNLRDLLKIRQKFSAKEALPLMIGLARGLAYAIENGVSHRDIKASNILISTSGTAKLVDFGLATIESEGKKSALSSQRTVDYSALERTCGSEKGDPRSDIYFLGCVFYQMLTGVLPMPDAESKDPLDKMLKRPFSSIKPLHEQLHTPGDELSRIVEKMMRVDLKSRYQHVKEVRDDLEAYEVSLKAPPVPAVLVEEEVEFDTGLFLNQLAEVEVSELPFEPPPPPEPSANGPKTVLCVEAQSEAQDAFRKTLSKMGYRVILVGDPEVAAERYRESTPDAVIFDIDGLGPEAVDAFLDMHDKAREDGRDLVALVLLGLRQHALQERFPTDDRLVILAKPIKMKDVKDAISQLVPID